MGYWIHEKEGCAYVGNIGEIGAYVGNIGEIGFAHCPQCLENLYGGREVIEEMLFRVHISIDENREDFDDLPLAQRKRLVSKELSFTCQRVLAERVFKAACDAAVAARREKENGEKEEKVGGSE